MAIESWQIFHVALSRLPAGTLSRIYKRSSRLVYYWAADPRSVDETKQNPMDRIRKMLTELDTAGYGDYARAAIDYLAAPLGCVCEAKNPATSDKGSIEGETMDLTIALGKLVDEIRFAYSDGKISNEEKHRIKEYARQLKRESEELLDAAGVE